MATAHSSNPFLLVSSLHLSWSCIARTWILAVAIWGGLGMQDLWGQARRQAIQGLDKEVVWHDNVGMALQAQRRGEIVQALDLSRQRLKYLPRTLEQLPDLKYLVLNRNKLRDLPKWLSELTDLRAILADHNQFDVFPVVLLDMPLVTQISMGENYIPAIPLDIDKMASLKILELWGNVLARFPASLGDLPSLQALDLLHNEMTAEEQEFLKSLLPTVELNMSEPCLCEFDDPVQSNAP